MLIHDRFVFLHVPKTGGRFIRKALLQEVSGCTDPYEERSRHYGWDMIPEDAAGRPVLAFVRNPWDWYVSWYTFVSTNLEGGRPWKPAETQAEGPLLHRLFIDRSRSVGADVISTDVINDFATTIRGACAGFLNREDRTDLKLLGAGADMADRLMEGHDFYTARLMTMFSTGRDTGLLTIGRLESLIDDLLSFLDIAGVNLSDEAAARIRAIEPVGASRRSSYRDYYDDELRDLVGSSCKTLIEQFDYSF